MSSPEDLREQLGDIDIYLLDQILKGCIGHAMRVLDAGCGDGRNLVFLLRSSVDVHALDPEPERIAAVRRLATRLAPHLPRENFRAEAIEGTSFAEASFDVVIAIAVLHFARGPEHFREMLETLWRLLVPGGMLFARLASRIGIESRVTPLGAGRYHLPDGTDRYLVDEALLTEAAAYLGAEPLEPLKTVNVANQRAMTTWVLRKRPRLGS